ncbi:MAG: ABC transporter [Deltaproteobacteria bacterium]|nr:MAG: ABC transporter [Deltaproteobacteria bacterium]
MIEVKELTKRFGSTVAVDNISFEVNKGEILGFLGPNGAGKTTTMRILTCFFPPDSGKVNIEDLDLFENSLEIRKRVGYLPESSPLYQDMMVIDYLDFVGRIRKIPSNNLKKKIDDMIQICGLEGVVYKDIGKLSKGYRQRVGLAQTLIHDPDILILDEPTQGLDPNQIIEIRELIKEIGKEKTVILSSHILPEVSATCGRIVIINKGKIVGSGTPEEMISKAEGADIIFARVRGPKDLVESKLKEIKGLDKIQDISPQPDGTNLFKIKAQPKIDISEDIFFVVAQNGWSLSELTKEKATLEDVFKQLTTGSEANE